MWHFKKNMREAAKDEAGYTLLELLVVLVIVTLIVGIAGPMVIRQFETAKSNTARIGVNRLMTDLELFRVDTGRWPTEEEDLDALISSDATGWNGPYLPKASMLDDPWGNKYLYTLDGDVPEVRSLGRDGVEDGEGEDADISSKD